MPTETLLNFPTCHIRIYNHRILRSHHGSSRTYYYNSILRFTNLLLRSSQFIRIKIIFQLQIGHIAKQHIFRHEAFRQSLDPLFRFHQITYIHHLSGEFF